MAKMMICSMPDIIELLLALGRVAVRRSQLDYILQMTVKTLTGATTNEALADTEYPIGGATTTKPGHIRLLATRRRPLSLPATPGRTSTPRVGSSPALTQ
jgi:hypothetical protein